MGLLAIFKNSSIANLRYNRVNDSYVCNVKEETDGGEECIVMKYIRMISSSLTVPMTSS